MLHLVALVFGNRVWKPYSLIVRWIMLSRGIRVGSGFYLEGSLKLRLNGRADAVTIGRNVTLAGNVILANRENGKIIIEDNCKLDRGVEIIAAQQATLTVKHGSKIGVGTIMNCGGTTTIGPKALISGYVYVQSSAHGITPGIIVMDQPHTHLPITIGPGAWIGAHASILPGVTIGPGAIIGANAVVTKDIPANAIAVGVPARVIRQR